MESRESRAPEGNPAEAPNNSLFAAFAAPYFAYVLTASLPEGVVSVEVGYVLRSVLAVAALAWGWRRYPPLTGPRSPWGSAAAGAAAGVVGIVLWVLLLLPLVERAQGTPWAPGELALRLVAAGAVVPVFEELFLRGFILRVAYQWDVARRAGEPEPFAVALHERNVSDVPSGAWTWPSVAISTVAFALGHQVREWPAAVVFGLLMCWLWAWRKDLLSCIAAHAVANVCLALFVSRTGWWGLW